MNKTLRITLNLKNTYRVNGIIYSLRQIPLIKKLLPRALYKSRGLKGFAEVLSVIWEIITTFAGKLIYIFLMVNMLGSLYKDIPGDRIFMHILLFLTVIGAYANNNIFEPSQHAYYAITLMRMDAREYTVINFFCSIIKCIVGFIPFTVFFGISAGISLPVCIMLPFSIAGIKISASALTLARYEKTGIYKSKIRKYLWLFSLILLGAAYGLPALGYTVTPVAAVIVFAFFIPLSLCGIKKILSFESYPDICRSELFEMQHQMDEAGNVLKTTNEKAISDDRTVTSDKTGFEYLNELFMRRHKKILRTAAKRISIICAAVIFLGTVICYFYPETAKDLNEIMLTWLPYFFFIMYFINRGSSFTSALFMNCDHSLLTYSCFKKPAYILRLFRIRLREIIKINIVPALIIGAGLALILYVSGGTDNYLNYVVLFVSIPCISIFFSVHYLMLYYLFQPYNAGTEVKSGTYQIMQTVTYIACFLMMNLRMPTLTFGIMTIAFCVLYSIIACILVYKLAPGTFRLRN